AHELVVVVEPLELVSDAALQLDGAEVAAVVPAERLERRAVRPRSADFTNLHLAGDGPVVGEGLRDALDVDRRVAALDGLVLRLLADEVLVDLNARSRR